MTASCSVEGAKGPLGYKSFVKEALQKCVLKPQKVVIWQRDQMEWDPIIEEQGERNWQNLVQNARERGLKADAISVKSSDGLYIIYTSGMLKYLLRILRSDRLGLDGDI